MAKAIFIIDAPKNCKECNMRRYHSSRFSFSCGLIYGSEIEEEEAKKRQEWCPLREAPKPKEDNLALYIPYNEGFINGYNTCVEEILGGDSSDAEAD